MIERKIPPVCMSIAGVDPSGGAGIIADIKTFFAFGCFPTAVIASITYQNTTAVFGSENQTAESVRRQAEPVISDLGVDALKTGMLPTGEIIGEVARLIRKKGLPNIVVDPVVRSTSGYDLIDDHALRALIRELFPLADLITPNIPEAERISGVSIVSGEDVVEAATIMREMGARNVLIKGGHFLSDEEERSATDHLFVGDELQEISAPYIDTSATHGTGCVLAAAITANLALGKDLVSSVKTAKAYVHRAIETAPMLGSGNSPINVQPILRSEG